MAQVNRSKAALRIMGDDLFPDELTQLFGCDPTYAQTKGEEIVGKKTGFGRIVKFGMWQFTAQERGPEDSQARKDGKAFMAEFKRGILLHPFGQQCMDYIERVVPSNVGG